MAISFLFSRSMTHLKSFDSQDCEKPKSKKLTDLEVAWDFDGVGSLTMGLQDPIHYKLVVYHQSIVYFLGYKVILID